MIDTSIRENFILPSQGKLYANTFDPHISLRSMTVMEEMRRQARSDTPFKMMSDVIEDCLLTKLPIHVYDLCIGDYQYLLHKLRIVSYGPDYKMTVKCSNLKCGSTEEHIGDLDSIAVHEYSDKIIDAKMITLPVSNKLIELKMRTPRDHDMIAYKAEEMHKKTKLNLNYALLYNIQSVIAKIDGMPLDPIYAEEVIKELSNRDANYILKKAAELEAMIGMDSMITVTCNQCGNKMQIPFRTTYEFFGPTND